MVNKACEYLYNVVEAVNSLAELAMSIKLRYDADAQYKVIRMAVEWEQTTAEFITVMELDKEFPNTVRTNRQEFVKINERLIKHLKKIQLQSADFDKLINTLKLENETLKEEITSFNARSKCITKK